MTAPDALDRLAAIDEQTKLLIKAAEKATAEPADLTTIRSEAETLMQALANQRTVGTDTY